MGSRKTLRGGLIGLGNVAVHGHLPAWRTREDVEIVAVSDACPDRRVDGAEALPAARWYASVDALLDDERLDFVDICTPPSSHAPLIERALRRGLHVLCEKPLVQSAEDLARIAPLADQSGRVLHTVHNWHHAPIVRRTAELLSEGTVGDVRHAVWHTRRTGPAAAADPNADNWRVDPAVAGGGVLTDHGWHVFYVLTRWIGAAPTEVSARLERRRHQALSVEDTASVRLTFPSATADIHLTWAADVRENWAEVEGTRGRLELRDDTLLWHGAGGDDLGRWQCPPRLSDGSHHPDWFHAVADEFVAEVTSGGAGRGNLAEAALCVALESAARESSRHAGRPVSVSVSA
ncbi:MAG TPA: Gfo/Idh/MocA family oxidoreductase [Candidatus Acidoferrum sp.]|nr:Gfo/Idh/MocA family oxidoreductase [Candidatus Acidoferrum sp.]